MGQFRPLSDSLQPEELALIDQAFAEIWAAIELTLKTRDRAKDEELKFLIREKLLALALAKVESRAGLTLEMLGQVQPYQR